MRDVATSSGVTLFIVLMSPRDNQEDLDKIYMNFIGEHTDNSIEICVSNFKMYCCINWVDE